MHVVSDSLFPQLIGQKIMDIHIELQTERSPSGNPQVTQPQFYIYKIIMEIFALVKF